MESPDNMDVPFRGESADDLNVFSTALKHAVCATACSCCYPFAFEKKNIFLLIALSCFLFSGYQLSEIVIQQVSSHLSLAEAYGRSPSFSPILLITPIMLVLFCGIGCCGFYRRFQSRGRIRGGIELV
jgi:hypothetical protein